jgi:hypothetical protein
MRATIAATALLSCWQPDKTVIAITIRIPLTVFFILFPPVLKIL